MKNWNNIKDRLGFLKRLQELIDMEPSQGAFAKKIGIASGTISRWKSLDDSMEPSPKTIDSITRETECSHDWLIYGLGYPFPQKEDTNIDYRITQQDIDELALIHPPSDDDDDAYEIPPIGGDPFGIESMANRNDRALAEIIAKKERQSEEEAFRQRASGRLSLFIDWIKDEFGTDAISIEQGFLALESGCEEFQQWKEKQLKKRTKEKNKTGTDN